jgi:hypothetical protein
MRDARIAELAGRQFNRVSWMQLVDLGLSESAIKHRLATGRLTVVEDGVFAVAPISDEGDWGRWMGATLTAPETRLSHVSAAAARGMWSLSRPFETVTRPGSGGPRRCGGVLVYRSTLLDPGECTELRGIPITSVSRTLVDLARTVSDRGLARAVREAVRKELITLSGLGDALGAYRGRRGSRRLAATVARYAGLPLERARSGAEVRAMEILRDAGVPLPRLNVRIAGEEADLSWPAQKLILEIDGGPFHSTSEKMPARRRCGARPAGPFVGFPPTTSTSAGGACSTWPRPANVRTSAS